LSLIAARACICNLGVNNVALPTNAVVARWTSVGDLDHPATKLSGLIRLPPAIIDGDNLASVSVSVPA
jgi:hypothetical protein